MSTYFGTAFCGTTGGPGNADFREIYSGGTAEKLTSFVTYFGPDDDTTICCYIVILGNETTAVYYEDEKNYIFSVFMVILTGEGFSNYYIDMSNESSKLIKLSSSLASSD